MVESNARSINLLNPVISLEDVQSNITPMKKKKKLFGIFSLKTKKSPPQAQSRARASSSTPPMIYSSLSSYNDKKSPKISKSKSESSSPNESRSPSLNTSLYSIHPIQPPSILKLSSALEREIIIGDKSPQRVSWTDEPKLEGQEPKIVQKIILNDRIGVQREEFLKNCQSWSLLWCIVCIVVALFLPILQ
eukprot:TRINITY_DN8527_c0_g1_i1.p1 TRINITY_DN8527_c0_g1~~TRINITY_DN8527_c0_g1_i1.p1  ORF type:complete len:191 (+),score=49.31 TRINITY_DN8527_c0_g1_i1:981-1553(+)